MTVTTTSYFTQPGGIGGQLLGAAQNGIASVANGPYTPYTGQFVAGMNDTQNWATGNQGSIATYQPNNVSAGTIPGTNLSGYMNPFTSQVINTSLDELNRNLAKTQQASNGQAAMSGAFGGDRAAIVNSENDRNNAQIAGQMIAGLNSQNFQQATGLATQDLNRQLNADQGNQFAGIQGANLRNSANNALFAMGNRAQDTGTQQWQAFYQNQMRNQSLPLMNATAPAQAWAPYAQGLSTAVQTVPDPSMVSQAIGAGATALGLLGMPGVSNAVGSGLNWVGNQVGNLFGGSTPSVDAGWTDAATGQGVDTGWYSPTDSTDWSTYTPDASGWFARGGAVDDDLFVPAYADGGSVEDDAAAFFTGPKVPRDAVGGAVAPVTDADVPASDAGFFTNDPSSYSVPAYDGAPIDPSVIAAAAAEANDTKRHGGLPGYLANPPAGEITGAGLANIGPAAAAGDGSADPAGEITGAGLANIGPQGSDASAPAPSAKPFSVSAPAPQPAGLGAYTAPSDAPARPALVADDNAAPQAQPQQPAGLAGLAGKPAPLAASAPAASATKALSATGNDWAVPVLQAGLAMMAGTHPNALVNIGRGGLAGVQAYQDQKLLQPKAALLNAQAESAQLANDRMRAINNLMSGNGGGMPGMMGGMGGTDGAMNFALQAAMLSGDPSKMAAVLNSIRRYDPNLRGQIAAAEAAGKSPYEILKGITVARASAAAGAQYKTVQLPYQNQDGSWEMRPVQASQIPNLLGGQGGGQGGMAPATFAQRIAGGESGGNDNARSSTSSAGGRAQFLDGTWLDTFKSAYPQQAAQMSDQQILALRGVPQISDAMTVAYAQKNAPALQQAGVPVNATTLALAHRFGPADAARVLAADARTPMPQLVSQDVLAANPDLKSKTAGQVVGQMTSNFGMMPVALGGGGGFGGGKPFITPQQQAQLTLQTKQGENDIEQMGTYRKGLVEKSENAAQMNALLDQMGAESQTWQMGKFADVKGTLNSYIDSMTQSLGLQPMKSVGDWQAFNKNAMELARQATRQTSSRAAVQEMQMIQKALPNDTMSPQGFGQIKSQLQGLNDYVIAKSQDSANYKGNPAGFESKWAGVSPTAFIVRRMSTEQAQDLARNLSKTDAGKRLWSKIVSDSRQLDQSGMFGHTLSASAQ